ncbi:7071_t:CDS:2 [Rhizophagus irregularis]|nr:7071_t:CDS:2 [Rhizophagus irregularis]
MRQVKTESSTSNTAINELIKTRDSLLQESDTQKTHLTNLLEQTYKLQFQIQTLLACSEQQHDSLELLKSTYLIGDTIFLPFWKISLIAFNLGKQEYPLLHSVITGFPGTGFPGISKDHIHDILRYFFLFGRSGIPYCIQRHAIFHAHHDISSFLEDIPYCIQ